MTPILLTHKRYLEIFDQIIDTRGQKYRISFVLKRDLGWTPRLMTDDHSKVWIDFWEEHAKSGFLIEFGTEGHVQVRSYHEKQVRDPF